MTNPTGLDLYVIAGQSNMRDRDETFIPPQEYIDAVADCYSYNDTWHYGRWQFGDPVGETRTVLKDNFGAMTLALTLAIDRKAALGNPVGIVTCAKGSTSAYDWRVSGGALLAAAIARIQEAMVGNTVKGLVWYQGEAEQGQSYANFVRYYFRIISILNHIRTEIGVNFPVVIVGIGDHAFPTGDQSYAWQTVQALQPQIAKELGNAGFVSAAGLPRIDSVHLTGEANLTLGEMVAAAFAELD